MSIAEVEEIDEIIERVYEEQFGFRACHREVYQAVLELVDHSYTITGSNAHLVRYGFHSWVKRRVTAVFNRDKGGLPFAPVVNTQRQHVPLQQATFAELEYIATSYVRRGDAEYFKARRVSAVAQNVYGRQIVVDGVPIPAEEQAA